MKREKKELKKVECLSSGKGNITTKNKAQIIYELREKFNVSKLVKLAVIKRSTYYYWIKNLEKTDKYVEIKTLISSIFHEHQGRYGYRRITLELRNRGIKINHKTVRRLINLLSLKCLVRLKL